MPNEVTTGNLTQTTGVSRLALLTAFIAGAFAAWILITINIQQQEAMDAEAIASQPMVVAHAPKPNVSNPSAPKPAPGVTVHTSAPKAPAKAGAPKATSSP